MSWTKAKAHMDDYFKERIKALNNEQRQKWFTTPVDEVSELVAKSTGIFDRKEENDAWEAEYTGDKDIKKLGGWRVKVATLSSATRDLRSQFACWSSDRVRVPLDWDRFQRQRLGFSFMRLDHLDQILEDKLTGMEPLA